MEANTPCHKCGKSLHPRLKSGRQICTKCGWSNKQTEDTPSNSKKSLQGINNYLAPLIRRARQIDRKIIIGGTFALGSILVFSTGVLLFNKHETDVCRAETKEVTDKIAEEWADAMSLAKSSSRINIGISIATLQNIKRKTSSEPRWPKCALVVKTALLHGMKSDIRQLTSFASNKTNSYHSAYSWEIYELERMRLVSGNNFQKASSVEEANKFIYDLHERVLNQGTSSTTDDYRGHYNPGSLELAIDIAGLSLE